MRLYRRRGSAIMACPRLGRDTTSSGPPEPPEVTHEGALFIWWPGSQVAADHPELTCPCGRRMAYVKGDDPETAETYEAEGPPGGG